MVKFARVQVDYSMGATGRSYIVGFGRNPPRRVSCIALKAGGQLLQARGASSRPRHGECGAILAGAALAFRCSLI